MFIFLFTFAYVIFLSSRSRYFLYLTDGNENISANVHAANLKNFGTLNYFLADESTSFDIEKHPVTHLSQGNWPRIPIFLLQSLGLEQINYQILFLFGTIGLFSFFLFYKFFSIVVSQKFATIFVSLMFCDAIFFTQWLLNIYRIWAIFLFACVLFLSVAKNKFTPYYVFSCFLVIYYNELVNAVFLTLVFLLFHSYFTFNSTKSKSFFYKDIIFLFFGATISLLVLFSQTSLFIGFRNTFFYFKNTMVSRNGSTSLDNTFTELLNEKSLFFWLNFGTPYGSRVERIFNALEYNIFHFDVYNSLSLFPIILALVISSFVNQLNSLLALRLYGFIFFFIFFTCSVYFTSATVPASIFFCFLILISLTTKFYTRLQFFLAILLVNSYLIYDLTASSLFSDSILVGTTVLAFSLGFSFCLIIAINKSSSSYFKNLSINKLLFILISFSMVFLSLSSTLFFDPSMLLDTNSFSFLFFLFIVIFIWILAYIKVYFFDNSTNRIHFIPKNLLFFLIPLTSFTLLFSIILEYYEIENPSLIMFTFFVIIFVTFVSLFISNSNFLVDINFNRIIVLFSLLFLVQVFVSTLSPGYVSTGYLARNIPLVYGLYISPLAILIYIFAHQIRKSNKLNLSTVGSLSSAIILSSSFLFTQFNFLNSNSVDSHDILYSKLSGQFKHKSIVTNTYATPISYFTKNWSYLDSQIADNSTPSSLDKDFSLWYLFYPDRSNNPDYLSPDLYLFYYNPAGGNVFLDSANSVDSSSLCSNDGLVSPFLGSPVSDFNLLDYGQIGESGIFCFYDK